MHKELQQLVDQHARVLKQPAFTYQGPGMGELHVYGQTGWLPGSAPCRHADG